MIRRGLFLVLTDARLVQEHATPFTISKYQLPSLSRKSWNCSRSILWHGGNSRSVFHVRRRVQARLSRLGSGKFVRRESPRVGGKTPRTRRRVENVGHGRGQHVVQRHRLQAGPLPLCARSRGCCRPWRRGHSSHRNLPHRRQCDANRRSRHHPRYRLRRQRLVYCSCIPGCWRLSASAIPRLVVMGLIPVRGVYTVDCGREVPV